MRQKIIRQVSGIIVIMVIAGLFLMFKLDREIEAPLWEVPGGISSQGPGSIIKYGCFSCHAISGIRRANGRVGPKLHEIKEQMYVGGVLANSPDNMIKWIRYPQRFSQETAMPELGVSDRDARDIAAYLFK